MRVLILAPFSTTSLTRLGQRVQVIVESWLDTNRLQDPEQLGARLALEQFDVVIVEADFIFAEVFEAAPRLRLVGVCRNALHQVDLPAASARGVPVVHAPGRNTAAVAEMTLALMLALARRIPQASAMVLGGGWRDPAQGYRMFRGREIAGATVGVVGFGQIGRAVARRCVALGARVLVHDPFVPPRQVAALGGAVATLERLAARSDFVTLHLPDIDATRHLVDTAFLARLRRGAYLINTGGGGCVDPDALAEALAERRIAGAALDVFEGQPLPASSPLCSAPNVILTPHIGGATAETVERHSRMMTAEVERLLDGRPLRHVANPEYRNVRAG
ncbi:MAG TPA: NAD(P)-dependent oxidoreductase [Dehalococcoidia bacterium]|nr:NAD(P)-dependent oxidoreductase [Dehalococcoidia bacterium]